VRSLVYPVASGERIELMELNLLDAKRKTGFFMLPGKDMSLVRLETVPPVPERNLDAMIKMKIKTLYPGKPGDTLFDYISFRKGKKRIVVIYFIKKEFVSECPKLKGCRGILLPLQFVNRRILKRSDFLIAEYPDMIEIWRLEEGIPYRYERTESFHEDSIEERKKYTILAFTDRFDFLKKRNNVNVRKFFSDSGQVTVKPEYFPDLSKRRRDFATPVIIGTAFMISLAALAGGIKNRQTADFILKRAEKHLAAAEIRKKEETTRLETINTLTDKLDKGSIKFSETPYHFLSEFRKAAGTGTKIISFIWKESGKSVSVSCRSIDAAEALSRIRKKFKNVNVSGITLNNDGTWRYRIYMEKEK